MLFTSMVSMILIVSNIFVIASELIVFRVEELSIFHVIIRIVTCQWIRNNLVICISEVDITHVLFIMEHIGVKSIVVPEVMLVISALIMSNNHSSKKFGHSVEHIGPEDWSH
jgi:hypothetical protein